MRAILSTLCIFSSLFILSACNPNTDDQNEAIEAFYKENKIGSGDDYFLVKDGFDGKINVAVFFGMSDDQSLCNEMAALYMTKYPGTLYYCAPAN